MLSHADNTEDPAPQASSNALRTQRLSPDEARAVIDLWQAEQVEQTGLTDRPAVPDVAEGLDLSVEDVQRLLAEVRTRRDAESRLLAHEQELAEIRLAEQQRRVTEEQRKLGEIQRQQTELERKAAEAQRQRVQAELPSLPVPQTRTHMPDAPTQPAYIAPHHPPPDLYLTRPADPLGLMEILYGFLPGFIAVSVALLIVVLFDFLDASALALTGRWKIITVTDKPAGEIIEAGTTSLVTQRLEVPPESGSHLYSPPPSAASSSALRTQRLSPDEARAVIDLWQAEWVEQTGLTDRPAVPDVAEGLDLSVEDVQRLLAEVRTRRDAESRLLAHEQELAEIRLAEEQRKLAEIRRQRAELERAAAEAQRQETDHWRRPVTLYRPKGAKPKRADTKEWTGDEAFWQETDADKEYRLKFRARRSGIMRGVVVVFLVILASFFALFFFGAILEH